MKNKIVRIFSAVLVWVAVLSCASEGDAKSMANLVLPEKLDLVEPSSLEKKEIPIDKDLMELVKDMKAGWNLGNSFDATSNIDNFTGQNAGLSSLDSWGVPRARKETMEAVAKAGFKTIRIPVSWSNHIVDKSYTIDSAWMEKVREAVDWAIDYDLYVILNIHHDNAPKEGSVKYCNGYYPSNSDYIASEIFVARMWEQIAEAFKDYDGHLVFETLNEPRLRNNACEWNCNDCSKCREAMNCTNRLNQKAVDVIRASGGNNAKRFITVPSLAASPWAAMKDYFKVPEDSAKRVGVSTHAYSPYAFAMQKNKDGGTDKLTSSHKGELANMFSQLNSAFVSKGIPVIMGEYGATNKNNLSDREEWFKCYISEAKKYNVVCVLWDNNSPYNTDESERFGYLNRSSLQWYFPSLIKIIHGLYN